MDLTINPGGRLRLGDFLRSHFQDTSWVEFRAAIAFVKFSGVRHIAPDLATFALRGRVEICVGVDFGGSTAQGLKALIDSIGKSGQVLACHNEAHTTFHPKIYLFKAADGVAEIAIGSGNLTEGGLYTNYEAGVVLRLDPACIEQAQMLGAIERVLDEWADSSTGTAKLLDLKFLNQLMDEGYVLSESACNKLRFAASKAAAARRTGREATKCLFTRVPVRVAPAAPPWPTALPTGAPAEEAELAVPEIAGAAGFLMTLQRTDVGHGQTSAGTSRRSPEIFIPLAARDHVPEFWEYPAQFVADPNKPKKQDRPGVKMWLGAQIIKVNMMIWPDKHDFRLRSEALRSAGRVGDILRMEKTDPGLGFDYLVHIVPQGTKEHRHYLSLCVNTVRNSKKLWGYY